MNLPPKLRPNTPTVKSEIMDGELVLIDFESGAYFAGNATAAAVWAHLEAGVATGDLTTRFGTHYEAESGVAEAVQAFLGELVEASLVVAAEADAAATSEPEITGDYLKPKLDRFDDMAELLVLDPIHEVEERGWPHNSKS